MCEDCRWIWTGVHRDEYIQATDVGPWHVADGGSCPECGSDNLEMLVPWCPKCEENKPCECDMTEEEKREKEAFDNMSEEEEEKLREYILERVRHKLKLEDMDEVRRRNREKREHLEEMGAELIKIRFEDQDSGGKQ